jgi:hypothetical protein
VRLGSTGRFAINHPVPHLCFLEALLASPLQGVDPGLIADEVANPVPGANIVEDTHAMLQETCNVQPGVTSRIESGAEVDADSTIATREVASGGVYAQVLPDSGLIKVLADDVTAPLDQPNVKCVRYRVAERVLELLESTRLADVVATRQSITLKWALTG